MASVEENGTAHDQTTKPDVDWKMTGNLSIIVQQLKQEIENLKSKVDEHLGKSLSLHSSNHRTFRLSNHPLGSLPAMIAQSVVQSSARTLFRMLFYPLTPPRMIDTTKVIV